MPRWQRLAAIGNAPTPPSAFPAGRGKAGLIGSGVRVSISGGTTSTKPGFGRLGLVGSGADVLSSAETGYGTIGASGFGFASPIGADDMTLIQEIAAGGSGSATIDFTSIPSTYRHLELWVVAQTENATEQDLMVRLNNDSGSSYTSVVVRGNGTAASSAAVAITTQGNIMSLAPTGAAVPSHGVIKFPYYATGSLQRFALSEYVHNSTGTTLIVGQFSVRWSSTAAINRITLFAAGGATDIKTGSIFSLYGVT